MTNGNVFEFTPDWQGKSFAVKSVQLPLVGTELVIPDSYDGKPVREIKRLFPDQDPEAKKLVRVTIPDSVVRLDGWAFHNCENLVEVKLSDNSKLGFVDRYAFWKCKRLANINLPATLTGIGESAFYGCESLKSIRLGEPLILLGERAFARCTGLKKVTFDLDCNLPHIKPETFEYCDALETVEFSRDIQEIQREAFVSCSSLKNLVFPEGCELKTIGKEVFRYCNELESVSFANCMKLKSIEHWAFYGNKKLKAIEFPKGQQVYLQQDAIQGGVKKINYKSQGCYVATCVYGSYDCAPVWTLRRFRDEKLAKSMFGRAFICLYYKVSPAVVEWFGKRKWFNSIFRPLLDALVSRRNKAG